jgi:beta-lactamase class A
MKRWPLVLALTLLAGTSGASATHAATGDWVDSLGEKIARIDADTPGRLGVYVKHLGDGQAISYGAERLWYLASTIKVPVAVVLLQKVEEGELSLDEQLTLKQSDYVDGAGDLLWHEPGTRLSLGTLLKKMLEDSDSTATDMLIRHIGEEELFARTRELAGPEGFSKITTILQVRYDAYRELHPSAEQLSNMDFIRLKNASPGEERYKALVSKLPTSGDLQATSIEEAFERYYERNLNSGTLEAFGELLEKIVRGELLSAQHTDLVLRHMENITTGERRIKAGLPPGTPFAQKTGTQIGRACNVGVIHPRSNGGEQAVIIAACMEKHDAVREAEQAFKQLGESLAQARLID